jgi:hypothetical protein
MFRWVIVSRQLHFHIYYLFVDFAYIACPCQHRILAMFIWARQKLMLFSIYDIDKQKLAMLSHSMVLTYTYHSRFIPEGVAEASQIFLRDTHILPKLAMRNTADVPGGKPIAVLLQSISGVCYKSFSRLLRHPWKKERGVILLFCPGHHTRLNNYNN